MQNCRNCKHAEWSKTKTGRKRYQYQAFCTVPNDLSGVSLSLLRALGVLRYSGDDFLEEILLRDKPVFMYENKKIDCPTWEKE